LKKKIRALEKKHSNKKKISLKKKEKVSKPFDIRIDETLHMLCEEIGMHKEEIDNPFFLTLILKIGQKKIENYTSENNEDKEKYENREKEEKVKSGKKRSYSGGQSITNKISFKNLLKTKTKKKMDNNPPSRNNIVLDDQIDNGETLDDNQSPNVSTSENSSRSNEEISEKGPPVGPKPASLTLSKGSPKNLIESTTTLRDINLEDTSSFSSSPIENFSEDDEDYISESQELNEYNESEVLINTSVYIQLEDDNTPKIATVIGQHIIVGKETEYDIKINNETFTVTRDKIKTNKDYKEIIKLGNKIFKSLPMGNQHDMIRQIFNPVLEELRNKHKPTE